MGQDRRFILKVICFPIKIYQYFISPVMKPSCCFLPSCSDYAIQAIQLHGVCKGGGLACWRLLRCHPWSKGGYDPVLSKEEKD